MTRQSPYTSTDPFLLWSTLTLKAWEMMFASAQVISHRTGRMALAGPIPSARDRREFHLMGQEKIDAITESLQEIALRMLSLNQQLGLAAFQALMSSGSSLISLFNSRTLPQTFKAQNDMLQNTMSHAPSTMTQLGESFAKTMHKGMTPIHSRATANARRLARTKLI